MNTDSPQTLTKCAKAAYNGEDCVLTCSEVDIAEKDSVMGRNLVHWFAAANRNSVLGQLLEQMSEDGSSLTNIINAVDNKGQTPLGLAQTRGFNETAETLKKHGAQTRKNESTTPQC